MPLPHRAPTSATTTASIYVNLCFIWLIEPLQNYDRKFSEYNGMAPDSVQANQLSGNASVTGVQQCQASLLAFYPHIIHIITQISVIVLFNLGIFTIFAVQTMNLVKT